ncbi:SOS response-associated peptidase [Methylobacterium radiodurans]|uniref:SOS response-associated peptidase n=1 Tax=Methylobacterium radiodurans TaxID=2202828 RepID=UPI0013A56B05
MCNLYSLIHPQAEIRDAFGVRRDDAGNLPPLPSIFPNTAAPVVRVREGERTLSMMRWGRGRTPAWQCRSANRPFTPYLASCCWELLMSHIKAQLIH